MRHAAVHTLGVHKVICFEPWPLRPAEIGRLFLLRIHRPLLVTDLSEGVDKQLGHGRVLVNSSNRARVHVEISRHPLVCQCMGNPGKLKTIADFVVPGSGSLFDIYNEKCSTSAEWILVD